MPLAFDLYWDRAVLLPIFLVGVWLGIFPVLVFVLKFIIIILSSYDDYRLFTSASVLRVAWTEFER